nr:cation-dependent mannose-6-phosphate receptor-like [Onthophagus taurus]
MAWKLLELVYYSLIFVILLAAKTYGINCGSDPCKCQLSEDKYLNFTELKGDRTVGSVTYHYYGCKNTVLNNDCKETTLCLEEKINENTTKWTSLGNQKDMQFENSKIGADYDIIYSKSRIGLICTEHFNESVLVEKDISKVNEPVLFIFSNKGCAIIIQHHGMSTGGTLVVLLLVGFAVYFVGGAIVLYCIRGARGKEMIPNIDFWQNLPGLVKDGVIYLLNGCRPTAVSTAESYDRI